MSLTQLQYHAPPKCHRISSEATEKDANFLGFRLVNKRARVRISPEGFDPQLLPAKAHILAISNVKGWLVAVTKNSQGHCLAFAPLPSLHAAFASSHSNADNQISFSPTRIIPLPGVTPSHLTLASHDSRLLLALAEGPIFVWDTAECFQPGDGEVRPMHAFPGGGGSGKARIKDVKANPGEDMTQFVAILRESGEVEVLDVQKLEVAGGWQGMGSADTTPTSISWSPKGKQLALGLQNGNIIAFTPATPSTPKSVIPVPSALSSSPQTVISTTWLSNHSFHSVYVPTPSNLNEPISPDTDQSHYIVSFDHKTNTCTDIKLTPPCFPSPGLKPPGSFVHVLRNWDPLKFLVVIGDSCSSDIASIACLADSSSTHIDGGNWCNLSLEENATPSLPLASDMSDTLLIGLELDLTNDKPFSSTRPSGEAFDVPPPPVLYAYASDGTLQAWYVVNSAEGEGLKGYSGMISAQPSPIVAGNGGGGMLAVPSAPAGMSREPSDAAMSIGELSDSGMMATSGEVPSPAPPVQTQQPQQPQSAFGQPSTFGNTSVFGSSSAFGGQASQPSAGPASAFGSSPSVFGGSSGSSGVGFGAYASAGPAKFGQASLGFGLSSQQPTPPALAPSQSQGREESMASDDPDTTLGGGLGGLGLGGRGIDGGAPESQARASSIFGPSAATSVFGQQPQPSTTPNTTPSSSSSILAPGSGAFGSLKASPGFGAFSNYGQKTPSVFGAQPSQQQQQPEPTKQPSSSGFGQSGFGAKPAFGQTSFGQQSVFGKPSFPAATPTAAPSGGGFAAYASGGLSAFSTTAKSTPSEPAKSSGSVFGSGGGLDKPSTPSAFVQPAPATGGFASYASGGTSPFAAAAKSTTTEPVKTGGIFGAGGSLGGGGGSTLAFGASPREKPIEPSPLTSQPPSISPPKMSLASISPSPSPPPARGGMDSPPLSPTTPTASAPPSPFRSSAPGPTTGAFGQLQASSTGFMKPAQGFGAFGGGGDTAKLPTSSPFFNPPKTSDDSSKPVIFRSTQAFSTPAKPASPGGGPTFGSPSAIGSTTPAFGKSSFGTVPSTPSVFGKSSLGPVAASTTSISTPPTSSSTTAGAFSGYSSSSGGFGAFAGSGDKSFSDLLKTGKDSTQPSKSPAPVFSTPPKADSKPGDVSSTTPVASPTPTDEKPRPSISVFGPPGETPKPGPSQAVDDTSSISNRAESEKVIKEESKAKEPPEPSSVSKDLSFSNLSVSSTGSFVHVTPPPEEEGEEGPPSGPEDDAEGEEEGSDGEEEGSERGEDDTASFLTESEPFDSEDSDSEGEEEEEPRGSLSVDEAARIPLPVTPDPPSRSPSATPKPEPLVVRPSPPPASTPTDKSQPSKSPSPLRDTSTTPPGSPVKEPTPPPQLGLGTLAPTVSVPVSSQISLGMGKPSTRPSRSSPLAVAAPITSPADEKPEPETPVKAVPAVTKAKPASPKLPFGQFGPPKPATLMGDADSRPKTPPLLSMFGAPAPKPPTGVPGFNLTPQSGSSTAVPTFSVTPPPTASPPPPSFNVPTQFPTSPSPAQKFTLGALPGGSLFGQKPPTPPSVGSPLSMPPMPAPPPAIVPPKPKEPTLEAGMQTEFAYLFYSLGKELNALQLLAQEASQKRADLSKSTAGTGGEVTKVEIIQFRHELAKCEQDILQLDSLRSPLVEAVRDLESDMFKAGTKKEEVVRFSRASKDPEFAKMLKIRSLGPEHVETQSRLRKEIRAIRDRVQKLEDHLQGSKKKLNELKTGKPSFRPPSLDTINRTLKNIDIAIEQQSADVAALTSKMAKLNFQRHQRELVSHHDRKFVIDQTPPSRRKLQNVTPSVAATTAAALNAERSAQKLKRALLNARREPFLNVHAVETPAATGMFQTPEKNKSAETSTRPPLPLNLPSTPLNFTPLTKTIESSGSLNLPEWALPPLEDVSDGPSTPSPNAWGSAARHRGSAGKYHSKPVQFRKSVVTTPSPQKGGVEGEAVTPPKPATTFDWGPLPSVKPMAALPSDVRRKD